MKKITEKQQELLNFIKWYQRQYKTPPTMVEIGSVLKLKVPAVQGRIDGLEKKGILSRKRIYIIKDYLEV